MAVALGSSRSSPFVPSTGSTQGMWLDYYEGGWQTALPHGGYPDEVYGAEFGLHAELNNLPWDATIVEDSPERVAVNFKTRGVRMPVAADMTLSLEEGSSTLKLSKTAINEGEEDVEIVWLEHIAIGPPFLSDKCRLYVPDCTVLTHPEEFVDTQKLALGWEGDWPMVPSVDGGEIDFREMPPKEDRSLDMAYMTGMSMRVGTPCTTKRPRLVSRSRSLPTCSNTSGTGAISVVVGVIRGMDAATTWGWNHVRVGTTGG